MLLSLTPWDGFSNLLQAAAGFPVTSDRPAGRQDAGSTGSGSFWTISWLVITLTDSCSAFYTASLHTQRTRLPSQTLFVSYFFFQFFKSNFWPVRPFLETFELLLHLLLKNKNKIKNPKKRNSSKFIALLFNKIFKIILIYR